MSVETFRLAPLGECNRASFTCGVPALDRYFHAQAGQDQRRRIATVFVAEAPAGDIAGFYTLSATSILLSELPPSLARRLPRYPSLPAALLGRLAVATRFRGRKLGTALLADAVTRSARADIAIFAIVTDPKDNAAAEFYRTFGFLELGNASGRLFLPLETVLRAMRQGIRGRQWDRPKPSAGCVWGTGQTQAQAAQSITIAVSDTSLTL